MSFGGWTDVVLSIIPFYRFFSSIYTREYFDTQEFLRNSVSLIPLVLLIALLRTILGEKFKKDRILLKRDGLDGVTLIFLPQLQAIGILSNDSYSDF